MAAMIFPVLCFLLAFMQNAGGSLVLDINPQKFTPGLTQSLTVNCSFSFDGVSDVVDIITMIIAKENKQTQFVDLVSLSVFTPDQITETSQLNGTSSVSGYIEGDGQSYLSIHWSFPTASEGGVYRCEVNGVDSTGHPTQKSQTMMVTSQSASLEELLTKVSDLQRQLDRQETLNQNQSQTIDKLIALTQTQSNKISEQSNMISEQSKMISEQKTLNQNQSQTIQRLLSLTQTQSNEISAISAQVSSNTKRMRYMEQKLELQNIYNAPDSPFNFLSEYNSHFYLVSKLKQLDSKVAEQTCEDYGGYLVEINNSGEHQFLKGFLDSLEGVDVVLISGTDEGHSGQWTYTYNGSQLTYTDWYGSEPDDMDFFCIAMNGDESWEWYDFPCNTDIDIPFMCEVNIN